MSSPVPRVVAALGPTNTGKTHRAIERMLDFPAGMMALPLRLLAREVYDRVSARLGENAVALITGEEKRVPQKPRYFICTTEAMPLSLLGQMPFLAVDEVQLATHRERGHVFTDRILHARGTEETWLLGSSSMSDLLHELLGSVSETRSIRYSTLRHEAPRTLKNLPPRTAVVTFSVEGVYEIAERIRRQKGGAAVVVGALSPRTRNAQVALYQSGEVDFLVATDAIGMGLNLDIDHVVFAKLAKFDGQSDRELHPEEIAQIAGRAGRHLNDGTFSTLAEIGDLSAQTVWAVENHRFRSMDRIQYRNRDLCFDSLDDLIGSLKAPSPHRALSRTEDADDLRALSALREVREVAMLARDPSAVSLLWEVCQIPDYRKLLHYRHAFLRALFEQLMKGDGLLSTSWVVQELEKLKPSGASIEELTAHLSSIRLWSYIAHRSHWFQDGAGLRERCAALEDELSDALHLRLSERFVASETRPRSTTQTRALTHDRGRFAELLREHLPAAEEPSSSRATRISEARHEDFHVDRHGRIAFDGFRFASLVRGKTLAAPHVRLLEPDRYRAFERELLDRRLRALCRDVVSEASGAGLSSLESDLSPPTRGLLYQLRENLGVIVRPNPWPFTAEAHEELARHQINVTSRYVIAPSALSQTALERRALLVSLFAGEPAPPLVPHAPLVPARSFRDATAALEYGYEWTPGHSIRIDIIERIRSELAVKKENGATDSPVLRALELDAAGQRALLLHLGFREHEGKWMKKVRRRKKRARA